VLILREKAAELFIVDNTDEHWKALEYVSQWCDISETIDIATGFFEIGALLALEGHWQKVDKIRILIGGDTTRQTSEAIRKAATSLEESFSRAREDDLFLEGINAIVAAIQSKKIEIKVYRKKKFHAKTYITHARSEVIGSAALVGSSNFTKPGLTDNIELNVRVLGREVEDLQTWFQEFWDDAETCNEEILTVIQRHSQQYTPFEIYAKSLHELVKDVEPGSQEWEKTSSNVYSVLSAYQRQHYHLLKEMATLWSGGFLTDGVGLGKTLVGLMLAEFYASKGPGGQKNVLILATKTGVDAVWEPEVKKYLSHLQGQFGNVLVKSHTFLSRDDWEEQVKILKDRVDVVIIDEGHNFRNPGSIGDDPERPKSRYRRLKMFTQGKIVFHLTATPINNSVVDFLREIELFAKSDDLFAPIGIGSVSSYLNSIENEFIRAEREAKKSGQDAVLLLDDEEVRKRMSEDRLFGELVTQVSRKFAIESARIEGGDAVIFPAPSVPKAISYEFSRSNNKLLAEMERAFGKKDPLFTLPMYYPLHYALVPDPDGKEVNRQMQVVALIRTVFLKRFESSSAAFAGSAFDLSWKIIQWLTRFAPHVEGGEQRLLNWRRLHDDVLQEIHQMVRDPASTGQDDVEGGEDVQLPEFELVFEDLSPKEFDIDTMVEAAFDDLDQLKRFLEIILQGGVEQDNKYSALRRLLTERDAPQAEGFGPEFVDQKVLVFTEFADTARYLHKRLVADGVKDVDRLDGSRNNDRLKMIQRFSPYYNNQNADDRKKLKELRVLVTTDVLAEGVNLQDGTVIVNYDLHWNPVRLIQRIGRVDRRRNSELERQILEESPSLLESRDTIFIRNFLPPKAVEKLLRLQSRVGTKAWRISATLGIPTGKLLDDQDDFDDVKVFDNFKKQLYGDLSPLETLRLKWLKMCGENPGLVERVENIPSGVGGSQLGGEDAVFACFQFPEPVAIEENGEVVVRWRRTGKSPKWVISREGTVSEDLLEIDALIDPQNRDSNLMIHSNPQIMKTITKIRKDIWNDLRGENDIPLQSDSPSTQTWISVNKK
jgi:phosphatidylserine/phosphatidylglycerophosphate/cardiolipin synthase-like enzyme